MPGPFLHFSLTSLVFSRTPSSSWALLKCPPPPSWRSWAASVARGPGPQTGTPLPATLQGPLSALQGAAPLANRGRVGRGRLARPVCDRARATERTRELRWAVLGGKVGAPLPACLTRSPGPRRVRAVGIPGCAGLGTSPRTANAPQHRARPKPQPGLNRNANPSPLYAAAPHLSLGPRSRLCLSSPAVFPLVP